MLAQERLTATRYLFRNGEQGGLASICQPLEHGAGPTGNPRPTGGEYHAYRCKPSIPSNRSRAYETPTVLRKGLRPNSNSKQASCLGEERGVGIQRNSLARVGRDNFENNAVETPSESVAHILHGFF